MVVKRRNVWLSDEVWAKLDAIAEGRGSRSQVITEMTRITNATNKLMSDPNWPPNVGYHTVPEGLNVPSEVTRKLVQLIQKEIPGLPVFIGPPVEGDPDRRRVDVDSGQSRRREDQEKIQALSGPPTLAETRRMRAAAAKAFGQFRPAPKPGKR